MWRRTIDGHIRGVLNDFDLSSLRSATTASSTQRTGTLPYMAYQLLVNDKKGNSPKHLYRHDVESVFYVVLLICCRYRFVVTPAPETPPRQKVRSPFDHWYRLSRAQLKTEKGDFLMGDDSSSPTVNSGFTNFQPWIRGLHQLFMKGLSSRKQYYLFHEEEEADDFDDETLQDWVSYSSIVKTCGKFAGSSLVVRNDQLEVAVQ